MIWEKLNYWNVTKQHVYTWGNVSSSGEISGRGVFRTLFDLEFLMVFSTAVIWISWCNALQVMLSMSGAGIKVEYMFPLTRHWGKPSSSGLVMVGLLLHCMDDLADGKKQGIEETASCYGSSMEGFWFRDLGDLFVSWGKIRLIFREMCFDMLYVSSNVFSELGWPDWCRIV